MATKSKCNHGQDYKGYSIISADWVQSPTKKPYEGLVVIAPNGQWLRDGFRAIDECERYVDMVIQAE